MRRRTFLAGSIAAAGAAALPRRALAGDSPPRPLSPPARALLDRAWEGLDPGRVVDAHVHLVGLGAGGTGCYVNPRMRSPWHPFRYLRYRLFLSAGGVERLERADEEYLARLAALAGEGARRGRLLLLAMDAVVGEDGREDLGATEFMTPDSWVLEAARARPDLFLAAISVHPHRRDALDRLERGKARGAVLVKWLPNAQGIDPASPRCDPFYRKCAELRLPLLVHSGEEQAVVADRGQHLGHPLRLRRALGEGATVIAAHCASHGEYPDTDAPPGARGPIPAFRLFLRLMREGGRGGRLLGDLSATTHYNRVGWLPELLEATDLHGRLVNGSDYPLPALDAVVQLSRLVGAGVLEVGLRAPLRELWERNVFWFDLALKRSLARGGSRFPASVFMPGWIPARP